MTQRITLKNTFYMFVGRFPKQTSHELAERFNTLGGKEAWGLQYTEFIISSGKQAGNKESRARARGIPVLTYEQAVQLADEGYIDLEEGAIAQDLNLDEVIAELRGIFGEAPSSKGWTRCLELVERCDAEQSEPVLHYIEGHIAAWANAARIAWRPPHTHPLLMGVLETWPNACFPDELRVAPPAWVQEMAQKKYAPKHALIRALNLDDLGLNTVLLNRIFKNPYLTQLTHLNMGLGIYPTPRFYETFSKHKSLQSLEVLWLHCVREDECRGLLDNPRPLPHIKHVTLYHSTSKGKQLKQSPLFEHAETFTMHNYYNP